jgi:hypothetical protein
MTLVFKVSFESGNIYYIKKNGNIYYKKKISFNYIKNFNFSFLSLFHVVMFFNFCFFFPLNFTLIYIYIYYFYSNCLFFFGKFYIEFREMIVKKNFLSLFLLRGMTFFIKLMFFE